MSRTTSLKIIKADQNILESVYIKLILFASLMLDLIKLSTEFIHFCGMSHHD